MIDIPSQIAKALNLRLSNVEAVLSLLEEGCTIPFISRYRKECTGSLNEVDIRDIDTLNTKLKELRKRQEFIIDAIEKMGCMTPELREKLENATDATTLEDLYLPYKPKRRTRATTAREHGLEPLAKIIMAQNCRDVKAAATRMVNNEVPDAASAIAGACDIIAEWVSEDVRIRAWLRNKMERQAVISARIPKGKEEEGQNFAFYDGFTRPAHRCGSHQYLALKRGEREGALKLSVTIDDDDALRYICARMIKPTATDEIASIIRRAVEDGYKRLLLPSITNEMWTVWKSKADTEAISLFADNLRQLLMASPLSDKAVMGIDPGFRTGCKVVCLDKQGNLLCNDVIYPQRERSTSALKVASLVGKYEIDAIALGNGTASRETEQFLRVVHFPREVQIVVVSESGASVYSASDLAREEFPDYDVTVRGAVSIGRRLIDPLAELVKIDPKSIGVGQYQHDVDQGALKDSLDYTVMSCVNQVGVNVNTASPQLLAYISGIGPVLAANIVQYRAANGDFTTRRQLLKVPRMGEKAYEQAAGFLRIPGAKNPLDNSAVHPESYAIVENMAIDMGIKIDDLIRNEQMISAIAPERYVTDKVGLPTLHDILSELRRPGRDPREPEEGVAFDPNVMSIEDLHEGMVLSGVVTNVTAFGAFVNIGIHDNGLVHVSQMSDQRVTNPQSIVKVNQRVRVRVIGVDLKRNRISLSMRDVD